MYKNILLAPDSFKGTLSCGEVCEIEGAVLKQFFPEAAVRFMPMADGGEGTIAAIHAGLPGVKLIPVAAHDALGRECQAQYALLPDGVSAVVELASASGLERIAPRERNPWIAGTYGTGEVLKAVIASGVRRIVVALGGSATVDGGVGIAIALGAEVLDKTGASLPPIAASLAEATTIKWDPTAVSDIEVIIASDVTNPLLGQSGAAAVFGPQKGADDKMVGALESALSNWANLWQDDGTCPGDGAAGGAGFILRKLFSRCSSRPGAILVGEIVGLDAALSAADLVITGEGASDEQTLCGKLPWRVADAAARYSCPVALLSGFISPKAKSALEQHFQWVLATVEQPLPKEQLTAENARVNLATATGNLARILQKGGKIQ